jgi:hypothetical protein
MLQCANGSCLAPSPATYGGIKIRYQVMAQPQTYVVIEAPVVMCGNAGVGYVVERRGLFGVRRFGRGLFGGRGLGFGLGLGLCR